ncbi:MAG: hypothetical protein AAFV88_16100 [Planctomycetota bacterium]
MANLLLDGIQPADVVTEESIEGFRDFLAKVRIGVDPIFISGDELQDGEIRVTVTNGYATPISIDATINGLPLVGLDMESQTIQAEIEAGETLTKVVPFRMKEPVELARFRRTSLEAKVASIEDASLRAEWSVPAIIDREYAIFARDISIDGRLDDWSSTTWWETDASPPLAGSAQNWNGPADGSFRISVACDDDNLNFAAKVADERIVDGDQLTVAVDPRPLINRLERNRLGRETIALTVEAPASEELASCKVSRFGRNVAEVSAYGRRIPGGYELEFSAPIKNLVDAQGSDWSSFQVGARLVDVDSSEEETCEVLWRSSPNRRENREFAHVIRK